MLDPLTSKLIFYVTVRIISRTIVIVKKTSYTSIDFFSHNPCEAETVVKKWIASHHVKSLIIPGRYVKSTVMKALAENV